MVGDLLFVVICCRDDLEWFLFDLIYSVYDFVFIMLGDNVVGLVLIEESYEVVMVCWVFKKIDRVIILFFFCIYIFNFVDKVILLSVVVFGLWEDNVSVFDKFDERYL